MTRIAKTLALTLAWLIVADLSVAAVLAAVEARWGPRNTLVRYFNEGISVPTKHRRWTDIPGQVADLTAVAWPDREAARSAAAFAEAPPTPVVRDYGMSFSGNILNGAKRANPDLPVDNHGGPGASPNTVFAFFEADRAARRPGDVVTMGVLASSVPGLASLSHRTRGFIQPGPHTFPIWRAKGEGLTRIDPVVGSLEDEMRMRADPDLAAQWRAQLVAEDRLYTPAAFVAPWADASPLARLIRRNLAVTAIAEKRRAVARGDGFPVKETLRRLVLHFVEAARAEGVHPVVLLIQNGHADGVDLRAWLAADLDAVGAAYLATADHVDPRDPANFAPDGHFSRAADARLGAVAAALIEPLLGR